MAINKSFRNLLKNEWIGNVYTIVTTTCLYKRSDVLLFECLWILLNNMFHHIGPFCMSFCLCRMCFYEIFFKTDQPLLAISSLSLLRFGTVFSWYSCYTQFLAFATNLSGLVFGVALLKDEMLHCSKCNLSQYTLWPTLIKPNPV